MADPLSITTSILALVSTVDKTSIAINDFAKTCREARSDLLGVSQELSTLKHILDWLKDDTERDKLSAIPNSLAVQIRPIISDCDRVLKKIDEVVKGLAGALGPAKWALGGKRKISCLREALAAHRGALNVTMETISIVLARDIKTDTTLIREDTIELKLGQEQIIAKIEELQAQLPRNIRDRNSFTTFIIQRYLDGLTSYTETVCHEDVEWSDNNDSVAALRDSSAARSSTSPNDEVECERHHSTDAEQYEDAEQFLSQELTLYFQQFLPLAHHGIRDMQIRTCSERNLDVVTAIAIRIGNIICFVSPLLLLFSHTSSWTTGIYMSVLRSCFIVLCSIMKTDREEVQLVAVSAYSAIMTTYLFSAEYIKESPNQIYFNRLDQMNKFVQDLTIHVTADDTNQFSSMVNDSNHKMLTSPEVGHDTEGQRRLILCPPCLQPVV